MKKLLIIFVLVITYSVSNAQVILDDKNAITDLRSSFNMIEPYLNGHPFVNLSAENKIGQRIVVISLEKKSNDNYIFSLPSEEMIGQFLSIDINIREGKIYIDRYFTKPVTVNGLERLVKVDPNHSNQKPMKFLEELMQIKISIWEFIIYADMVKRSSVKKEKTSFPTRKI